jgi:beta-glucanase (GH16 family)
MQKLVAYILILITTAVAAQPPGEDTTRWNKVFADEFTGSRLNRTKWDVGYSWGQRPDNMVSICNYGQPNEISEPQAYVDFKSDTHNVKVFDGTVKIYTREENMEGEFWDWDNGTFNVTKKDVSHTTGLLVSKQKFYRGYYEIRFKLPPAPRFPMTYAPFGPSFWMFEGDCWSEIDGFEFINGQDRTITSNVHYVIPPTMIGADTICENTFTTEKHKSDYYKHTSVEDNVWHTFGFNWEKESVKFYLDGELYFTSTMEHIDSLKPMVLITGIASPVNSTCVGLNGLFTKFPYVFEIDYIRVWQKK